MAGLRRIGLRESYMFSSLNVIHHEECNNMENRGPISPCGIGVPAFLLGLAKVYLAGREVATYGKTIRTSCCAGFWRTV